MSLFRIFRVVTILGVLVSLAGCLPPSTGVTYDRAWTSGVSKSKPIYLAFRNNKKSPYYFVLRRHSNAEKNELLVYWDNRMDNNILFDSTKSTLQFLIDKSEILTLTPIKPPRVSSYLADSNGHQEEAIFALTNEQLEKLAYAKTVDVQLQGKYALVAGRFDSLHTFPGFKNFVNNELK